MENIDDLINYCYKVHKKGLVCGSGGNISCRVEGGFLITSTGTALEAVTEDRIVFVKNDGTYDSTLKPSKEYALHWKSYLARPDISVVMHVHSIYSIAYSCLDNKCDTDTVPVYTPGYGARIGKLPIIPYLLPGSKELANAVSSVILKSNCVLLKNHGLITVGKDMQSAMNLIEEIEENIHVYFLLNGQGISLTDQQIKELSIFH